jgi:hypothetical protein
MYRQTCVGCSVYNAKSWSNQYHKAVKRLKRQRCQIRTEVEGPDSFVLSKEWLARARSAWCVDKLSMD